ncbi:MAG: GMC family oxidoreductase [Bdellovibrionota bacterium]
MEFDFDYIVIGSGFGGSVSAMRLAEKGYKVCVLERGKRYRASDFAKTNWDLKRYLWMPLLRCFGIQNISLFKNVLILSGTGVGGGSLVYANTLLEPGDAFYQAPQWSGLADWKQELKPCYETAKKMLGVAPNPFTSEVDRKLNEVAQELGRAHTFESVNVGIYFGKEGEKPGTQNADPYFGGAGPERNSCMLCGACMVGCRHNAKNTLDKNYLYFAEKYGAEIWPESNVCDIRKLSRGGYEVYLERSTSWFFSKRRRVLTSRGVVFAAGVLGTVNLLFRCRDVTRSLPAISQKLGHSVRTNSEALIGVTTKDRQKDFSQGIAITSGFYADENTHIEPVRYPKGSSFMKLLAAPMADEGGRFLRPLKMVASTIFHPVDTLRLLMNTRWAESTVILLVMQTLDNKMKFKLGRNLLTLFRKRLTTEVDPSQRVPSYIAVGHKVARMLAKKIDGIPQSAVNEVLLQIPTTAHILGGCAIAASPDEGVIDQNHKVFGYENMYVCDGSVIPANLGVNPSLTITAMTERCMSKIPRKTGS